MTKNHQMKLPFKWCIVIFFLHANMAWKQLTVWSKLEKKKKKLIYKWKSKLYNLANFLKKKTPLFPFHPKQVKKKRNLEAMDKEETIKHPIHSYNVF